MGAKVRSRRMTAEGREKEMILKAEELARKQLEEGTASAQVITHYLKLGSSKERLEKEELRRKNELLKAKIKNLESAERSEEFYKKVISAMKRYSGESEEEEYDEEEML